MKLLIVLMLVAASALMAWEPFFEDSVRVDIGSYNPSHADPCFSDWNGDGLPDLLVGDFAGGSIRYFENTGTMSRPKLDDMGYLKADGKRIRVGAA